jgi:transketolase
MATMREQMVRTLEALLAQDDRLVVLLGNISAGLFDRALFERNPPRVYDLGILEQALIGVAAGMAMEGLIPVAHSIAPFLVERPFEQLKDDFCYQGLGGNFVSIGASYDYSEDGMTHHAPGDVQILRSLPRMQIVVPGSARELDALFREGYANGAPTYFRTSTRANPEDFAVRFGTAEVVREGPQATVIAVGPALAPTLAATSGLDVTVLYYTTAVPFDGETLRAHSPHGRIALVEPFYEGTLIPEVVAAMGRVPTRIEAIGVPRRVLYHYGTPAEHDEAIGLTPRGIRERLEGFLSAVAAET